MSPDRRSTDRDEAVGDPSPPVLADVLAARARLVGRVLDTPLRRYPALDRLVGTTTWVKHENFQVTGAFKVRGGINLMARLVEQGKPGGVVTASTGNHGQSIARSAAEVGLAATVCVPEGANAVKVEAVADLGADVVAVGSDFDDAREHAERLAAERGWRYVHSGNEPDLIAGVATATLEVLEALPELDAILVPVGGGSGAAAAGLVVDAVGSRARVIGVQSAAAPAAHHSWRAGRPVQGTTTTAAEGLATRTAFSLPQQMMRHHLDDFLLVDDEELWQATGELVGTTRSLVEPAAAAGLAGAKRLRDDLAGARIVLMVTGANISPDQLRGVV